MQLQPKRSPVKVVNPHDLHSCLVTSFLSFCSYAMSKMGRPEMIVHHRFTTTDASTPPLGGFSKLGGNLTITPSQVFFIISHENKRTLPHRFMYNKCKRQAQESDPLALTQKLTLCKQTALPVTSITLSSRKCNDISEGVEGKMAPRRILTWPSSIGLRDGSVFLVITVVIQLRDAQLSYCL